MGDEVIEKTDIPMSITDVKRAWMEIDLNALDENYAQLQKLLPENCEIMAIVKADAYGHGAERIAKKLREEGVNSFAVATVVEGVKLRESGLDGEILILNYTPPQYARLLHDNNLTQLLIDSFYARALDETGYKIHVHIAIDTGMHREGFDSNDILEIEKVYGYANLIVDGVSSHLSVSDSLDDDDTKYTESQIKKYYTIIESLRNSGYDTGKLHIQASYGMLNYPNLKCDYVRVGITLFGVMSHDEQTRVQLELKPVLSLKSIIAQVRWIEAGESVSYGRLYTAERALKLATVCIGYADGIPRHLSGNGGHCIVQGVKVPIVGRICMDLLMVDVTAVDAAAPGDVVTLIGVDRDERISCEEVALAAGTISNELLCRLGSRLTRQYIVH